MTNRNHVPVVNLTRRLALVVLVLLGAVVSVWGLATGRWWARVLGIGITVWAAVALVGPWPDRRKASRRTRDADLA